MVVCVCLLSYAFYFYSITPQLKASALVFKKNATALKKKMWWQEKRAQFMIAGAVVTVIGILVLVLVLKFKK